MRGWRRIYNPCWITTRPPTATTSTTLIWTASSMTPMCCCLSCPRSTRRAGRWRRWRPTCKLSLTASISSPSPWRWKCGIGRKPGRTARATPMTWRCPTTTTSAPSHWKTSTCPMCPCISWARISYPGTPSIWRRWETGPTCSPAPPTSANTAAPSPPTTYPRRRWRMNSSPL